MYLTNLRELQTTSAEDRAIISEAESRTRVESWPKWLKAAVC